MARWTSAMETGYTRKHSADFDAVGQAMDSKNRYFQLVSIFTAAILNRRSVSKFIEGILCSRNVVSNIDIEQGIWTKVVVIR